MEIKISEENFKNLIGSFKGSESDVFIVVDNKEEVDSKWVLVTTVIQDTESEKYYELFDRISRDGEYYESDDVGFPLSIPEVFRHTRKEVYYK